MNLRSLFAALIASALAILVAPAPAQDAPPPPPTPVAAPAPVAAPVATAPAPAPTPAPAPAAAQPAAVIPRREDELVPAPAASGAVPKKPSLADRVKAFTTANAGVSTLTAQVATLTTERDTARVQLAALTAERDTARAELAQVEAALSGQQNIVRATAQEIAQTVGIPAAQLPAPVAAGTSSDDITEQLDAITDPVARTAFFRANRAKINAAFTAQKSRKVA